MPVRCDIEIGLYPTDLRDMPDVGYIFMALNIAVTVVLRRYGFNTLIQSLCERFRTHTNAHRVESRTI